MKITRAVLLIMYFSFVSANVYSEGISLEETRRLYPKTTEDKEACEQLYKKLAESEYKDHALLTAYYGAVTATKANYLKEPGEKLKYFRQGRRLIEKAVAMDSLNTEIRFLRFTIQTNVPKAVKYDKEIDEDKQFLINNIKDCKVPAVRKNITAFLLASKDVSEEEKQQIKESMDSR